MIEIRAAGAAPWRVDDRESGLSTVAQCECASTLDRQSVDDDKFATTWRPAGVVGSGPPRRSLAAFPGSFGRYELLGLLGEGRMGLVFLAHDKRLDRQVAVKIPKSDHTREASVRFEREARLMAKLRHPHVCPVYDFGELDGTRFLTMAYVEGRTLAEHLAADPSRCCRQAAGVAGKLAIALHAVHEAGIIHRDVKPANIMIDAAGEPTIMDFGLATWAESTTAVNDGMVGTPAYMPPEQASGNVVGPAGDVYSLGVVLYEMLAGRIPFEGPLDAVLRQVVSDQPPPPPSRFNPGLDPKLEAICLRAMAKPAGHRFPSALALAEALH